jgi:predicted P-loop ATPase
MTPVVTAETLNTYLSSTKVDQTRIKDVGGFVGGYLIDGKRRASNVRDRQILSLDIDFGKLEQWDEFCEKFKCAAVIHATHKSTPQKPRYRLIMPLDRPVSAEEYMAISRKVAEKIGMQYFDGSTFQPNRLMFWPSCPKDVEFYARQQEGDWLCADDVLKLYVDWHDMTEWPTCGDENSILSTGANKQADPSTKGGIIGAFCRTYSISEAISAFLSDDYEFVSEGRYTYTKGSTVGGMITYEDKFAYSHHGTDPAGGKLCNAFDLCRIHLFGHLDKDKSVDRENALPSFKAMENFASKDTDVRKTIAAEKFAEAKDDFGSINGAEVRTSDEDISWTQNLEVDKKGEYLSSSKNIDTILKNDPMLKGIFKLNLFDNKRYITRPLPWHPFDGEVDQLKDVDMSGVRNYFDVIYGITSVSKIDDSVSLEFQRNSFHPIKDYLEGLVWDGKERVNTLLVDYFGTPDDPYHRAAIRKPLVAAISRVYKPGVKFDLVTTLVGPQGSGKSTFLAKLGRQWFSDTFSCLQGKEAYEQIQGKWIIEIGELAAMRKAEVETVKQFLTKCEDSYRPAYGRVIETYRRQCIFFGTTNASDFLRDATGNRRFMPVDVTKAAAIKDVHKDLTEHEVDMIWAEAYLMYKAGEKLYLEESENISAEDERDKHLENDDRVGYVEAYLDKSYPDDWDAYDLQKRRIWLDDPLACLGTNKKDRVCLAEIWCECFKQRIEDLNKVAARDLSDLMKRLKNWTYIPQQRQFSIYGRQRYFIRVRGNAGL